MISQLQKITCYELRRYHLYLFLVIVLYSITAHSQTVSTKTDAVDYNFKRGFYTNSFQLVLSSNTEGSTIRYTLDGSKPSLTNGQNYTTPITINSNAMVRAYAYSVGLEDSKIKTHSFIFPEQVIKQKNNMLEDYGYDYSSSETGKVFWTEEMDPEIVNASQYKDDIIQGLMDIPTLSIVMPKEDLWGENGIHWGDNLEKTTNEFEKECSIEMIYPQGYKGDSINSWQENAGIKIQGGGGRWDKGTYDHKQSFTLVFKGKYGAGKLENEIFADAPHGKETAVSKYDDIILRSGHNKGWGGNRADAVNTVYTRDQLGRDLQILMSGFGSHGTFVHLYLNGKYWGLYNPSERPDNEFLANHLGGGSKNYFYAKGKDSGASDDRVGEPGQSKARFYEANSKDYSSMSFEDMKNWVMMDESIASFLVYGYANPGDGPQYYYGNNNNPPGPVVWIPWDVEDSFEGDAARTGPPSVANMIKSKKSGDNGFTAFWTNKDFRMYFNDFVYKNLFNDGVMTDAGITAAWDKLTDYIYGAMICESARWGDERREPPFDRDDEWDQERIAVRNDFKGKTADFISKLQDAGYFSTVKAPLYLNGNNKIEVSEIKLENDFPLTIKRDGADGVVYYTTNGSDPRTWDLTESIAAGALTFTGASITISINKATVVKARTKNGSVWSPLHVISFVKDDPCASSISANGPTTFCSGDQVVLSAKEGAKYQWLKNGNMIPNATAQTYTATTSGDFSVLLTIDNLCSAISSIITVNIDNPKTWYADSDNDSKGDPNTSIIACAQPDGFVADNTDQCPSDKNKSIPGACGCNNDESTCRDCNGDVNGSAFLDDCEACVGGNTNLLECKSTIEAETACILEGSVDSNNDGFSGSGFVNTTNKLGASVSWVLNSTATQTATLTFRYANGGEITRDGQVLVNGIDAGNLTLLPTGSWTTWKVSSVNISLNQGSNNIVLKALSSEGLANIDMIHFSEGVSDANCLVTGISNKAEKSIVVYPIPTSNNVFWNSEQEWVLFNVMGQELGNGTGTEIDLGNFTKGVYFIKFNSAVVQVVKE